MFERNIDAISGTRGAPALVTVPAWFTVRAACKVAEAKGASSVAFYDQRGGRTTLSLLGLAGLPGSRLLASCVDLITEPAALAAA